MAQSINWGCLLCSTWQVHKLGMCPVQYLRKYNAQHWLAVRRHHRRLQALRVQRFRARLNLLAARSQTLRAALDPLVSCGPSAGGDTRSMA